MKSEAIHIGTSGWSYRHWSGAFYPADLKPAGYLDFYIQRFSCVELNSSFYHLPLKTTAAGWIRRTPEPFRFCPKMSRLVTHHLKLADPEAALNRFYDVFSGMKARLGPVLIQFPPGLIYDNSLINNFLILLTEHCSQFRFAIEIRHRSWIHDVFLDLLNRYGIAFVMADTGNRYPFYEVVTTDFVYLRFHGREHLYASDYSDSILSNYSEKIINWLQQGKEIWAFFNNDYHGFAVKNAIRLIEMVSRY